jgi:uncharacterized protein (DUF608 family)
MSKATFFAEDELFDTERPLIYEDDQLREIAFPLGGLGTGCVSLSGQGGLRDWEIFNRPNKASFLPYTFFTLWIKAEGREPVTRVVQSPPMPPFAGQGNGSYRGFGFGVTREDGSGLPHMRDATFRGEFPFAEVEFEALELPVQIRLEAYSPFIPLNPDDSGIPIAVLRHHVRNDGKKPVEMSLVGNIFNPIGYGGSGPFVGDHLGQNLNTYVDEGGVRGLYLTSDKYAPDHPAYGSMALTTTWEDVFHQNCWLRSGWFDAMHDFWNHFSTTGTLPERSYGPSEEGESDVGSLGLRVTLQPGETAILPFYITWYFPNFVKYWPGRGGSCECDCECETSNPTWNNYYASQWDDALDVARYYAAEKERLYGETRRFHDVLFDATLPSHVLDALSSQASILHSPTVLRLEDGTFYGFEGCHCDSGCCEGSCTHVWNYAQTAAFLFPSLERSMREADYEYNMRDSGEMCFRLQLPLGSPLWDFHPAADGQMGGILKVYRDWRLCGNDDWLCGLWPKVKKALEYAWEQWDDDRDGVMEGIQHNTYDIEFHGPNTMMGSFYLGALRAGEEMARHLGDTEAADAYHEVYEKGRRWMDRELFNGEYYIQKEPPKEVKYQYGRGCLSDQLIGQWLAHIVDLGYLFDAGQVHSAIKAVFEHNWRTDFWEHANPQRIYALNDEQGLLLCTWPHGGRPAFPFVYSDEVWCGIEYQVASHLIYEGLVEEGLAIVKGLRDRHDGLRRNPWNEFECGSHYARSLASWSLLTALSGYHFDMPNGMLGFAPRWRANDWRSFWSTGTGWGSYSQQLAEGEGTVRLQLAQGELSLGKLLLGSVDTGATVQAYVGEEPIDVTSAVEGGQLTLSFAPEVTLSTGDALTVELTW